MISFAFAGLFVSAGAKLINLGNRLEVAETFGNLRPEHSKQTEVLAIGSLSIINAIVFLAELVTIALKLRD